jgi:hypothetical protein
MASAGEVVRGVFTQQLPTKAVALLTALALWWYVGYELSATHAFSVTVTVSLDERQSAEWRLLDRPEHVVRVHIEGPRESIEQLSEEVTPFSGKLGIGEAELAGLMGEEVTASIKLLDRHFFLPNRRLRVVAIDPAALPIRLGRMDEEQMTVDVADLRRRIPTDLGQWTVTGVEVFPTQVRVVGPVTALARLQRTLPLEPPDLAGAQRDVFAIATIAAAARDEHIGWAPGARLPTVAVRIAAKPETRKFTVPVLWYETRPPEGFEIERPLAGTLEVTAQGPRETLARLRAEDLRALAKMKPELSTDPNGPCGNSATLEISVYPAASWPGVTVVDARPDLVFRIVPKPRPVAPPAGAGETPPGGNGKSGAPGAQGADPGAKSGG